MLHRKGFPESYDRKALLRFVIDIKSGKDEVEAPTYSHLVYDVVPDEKVVISRPDIVIIEGLNVLQSAGVRAGRAHRPRGQRLLRLLGLRRRRDQRHPPLVHRPVPAAARDRLPRPGVVLRPLRLALRGRGGRRGQPDLGRDQRPQPRAERQADPVARDAGAAQGPRPLGALGPPAQALRARRSAAAARAACLLSRVLHLACASPRTSSTRSWRCSRARTRSRTSRSCPAGSGSRRVPGPGRRGPGERHRGDQAAARPRHPAPRLDQHRRGRHDPQREAARAEGPRRAPRTTGWCGFRSSSGCATTHACPGRSSRS